MKRRLFPRENKALELLTRMAAEFHTGVGTLSEILGAAAEDRARLVEQLHEADGNLSNLHFALMTHVRTSFINPLPREDLFQISRHLVEGGEKVDGAADMILLNSLTHLSSRAAEQLEVINRQTELTRDAMARLESLEDLDEYCVEMLQLAKRAERTHRIWTSELMRDHKPAVYMRHLGVANQMVDATKDLRRVANYVGQILVKES
ncbi:nuclease PIN [Arthrobacter sp. I2-34]|uniref:Nuclease PIN n=1 Tax=Arthrobacter hankyongi TaxID=2904801 RepID=A0ABS9LC62_9MICC|nr:nuclease PIN [Arthrobacter hankyongi]MCG2624260.1 nuclease PIN [Arthrobacter hankyongi]